MSVPYGAPQQQPGQPGPAQQAVGLNLGLILPLVAAGLGLIAYLLAFADDVSSGQTVLLLMVAGALAGLTVLPKALKFLPVASVLSAVSTLLLLQAIIKSSSSVRGMDIVLLIVALLLTGAIVASLLMDAGILKFEPKPQNPYGQQQPGGWNPQSGGFPPPQGQHPQQFQQQQGQPQQPPSGPFGQPVQPQQPGAQGPGPTTYLPQPGQFGQQQPGTPPGGFGGPPQG